MTNIVNSSSSPYFLATLSSPISNVTGDGTNYTAIWNTLTDGSGYDTGTGVFTCSVPGDYFFSVNIYVSGLTASHTAGTLTVVATSGSFLLCNFRPSNGRTNTNTMMFTPAQFPLKMESGDTVYIDFKISNGTKVVTFDTLSIFTGARLP